jgi:hypothetical protein
MYKTNHIKKLWIILLSSVFYIYCHGAASVEYVPEKKVESQLPTRPLGKLFNEEVYLYDIGLLGSDRFVPISQDDRDRFWTEKCQLHALDNHHIEEFKKTFDQVCDNPIGHLLIKEIMAFLDMPTFSNVKIIFCYDTKDDTCILGPLDEKGEGSLRAQFKEDRRRGIINEMKKMDFKS